MHSLFDINKLSIKKKKVDTQYIYTPRLERTSTILKTRETSYRSQDDRLRHSKHPPMYLYPLLDNDHDSAALVPLLIYAGNLVDFAITYGIQVH